MPTPPAKHRPYCPGTDNDLRPWVGNAGDHMTTCTRCGCRAVDEDGGYVATLVRNGVGQHRVLIRSGGRVIAALDTESAYALSGAMVDAMEAAGVR